MSAKLKLALVVLYLAFDISVGLLRIGSSSAADQDDHSYLPPWMLDESGAVRKVDEKGNPPKPWRLTVVQTAKTEERPVKAEEQPVKAGEPDTTGVTAKATQIKTKVVVYVSDLFKRSLRFAWGE
ncbi:MAG: hypothetical protein ACLPX9_03875 [Rhodomicrobium sp.]